MKASDELRQENEALRERIFRLNAAILRISASLELDTVLQEVVDSARALTGARYGVITTVDPAGQLQDFVTSGFTGEEERRMATWLPDGLRLFEHLRDQEAPLRRDDFPAYVRSLGFSSELMLSKTFLGTPMRHRRVQVGNFFLAEKEEDGGFTDEDEEVLVLFASQGATAIANARTHRDEQRARADLEALVETSPVGVVVFDAQNGTPVTFNREARRIVESLRMPGHSAEELLDVLTSRLADGREVTLDQLKNAETLRAAEVELSVPDGRSLRMLINVTPIRSGDGEIESVVVTMQDLATLDELERLQAEFLSMVSHELRAPLTSIKGSTATVLGASSELERAEMVQFFRIIDEQADHMRGLISDLLDAGRIDSGTLTIALEPAEVAPLVEQARSTFLSGGGRHGVVIDLPADIPPSDGRQPARRSGPEQPLLQRVQALSGVVAHPGRGGAGWRSRRDFGQRRRPGRSGGPVASPVPEARRRGRRGGRGRHGGIRPGPGDLQGAGGGPRRPDLGRERRNGPGRAIQPSRFLWPKRPARAPRPARPGAIRNPRREEREPVRILVVDDDPQTLRFVRDALTTAGYTPRW